MFKPTLFRKLWVFCSFFSGCLGIFLAMGLNDPASATEFQSEGDMTPNASLQADPDADAQNHAISPTEAVIRGTVSFEPRYTRVHEGNPSGGVGSPNSEIYWSLVIKSGDTRYVLNQRMYPGSPVAPAMIDLQGVLLKSGSSVEIEGRILTEIPNYYILLDIRRITLLADSV